ncbi:sugar ABC transporter ATP-binding protein [Actinoplanes sp. RD1]|uniref:sugar ABC transporter ATP-binding protein n=1 Tax=Actinoplanes sp. RD1 TaxID=3064538 RepID=UPI002742775A|nr:sugar ABC transporter ATP-binding protein [Actinoplanes sp. RD1]
MLRASGLTKRYGGVTALDGAEIALRPGEIHALVGENGAGKSTLVKILSGVVAPDTGTIHLGDVPVRFAGPRDAAGCGIEIVSQELALFPDLTVAENLFVRDLPCRLGLVDPAVMRRRAAPVLAGLGLGGLRLRTPVARLTLADRQLLEISRALLGGPRVLILDEPTSALPAAAVDRLETVLRHVAGRGIAVLYISHFLDEVRRMADRVSVLRDGRPVLRGVPVKDLDLPGLIHAVVGAAPPARAPTAVTTPGGDALQLREVTVPGRLAGVSLTVAPGEITGVAGLEGAGHLTVLDLVCGLARPASGEVRLPGGGSPRSFRDAVRRGVAFVPGDRKRYGLMLDRPVWENATAVRALALRSRRRDLVARAEEALARLRFRGDVHGPAGALSGGNQQKVVFAKWLDAGSHVLVLDDPTRGVDVAARGEMHAIVRDLAASGRVVLLASTDLAELTELCHRVVVLRRGRVVTTLTGAELTSAGLSTAMNAPS